MNKFLRTNKDSGEEIPMFGTSGTIESINPKSKTNANGKEYHIFTANLEMPRGTMLCMGQMYKGALEFLGEMPKKGDVFAFATPIKALEEKNNKFWSISGRTVDAVDDELLSDLEAMDF